MSSFIRFSTPRVTGPALARRGALTAILCASIAPVAALSEPPASLLLAPREVLPPANLSRAPITGLTIGSLRIVLGTTTLDDVQEALKGGAIEYEERAGGGRYLLCYTIPPGESWQRIWLVSDAKTGRIEIDHGVSQIEALEAMNKDALPDCPIPSASYRPLHFDQGVWLGQSERGLLQALGRPAEQSGEDWSYVYYNAMPDRGPTKRTDHVVSMVQTQVQAGKITAIVVSQITTY